MIRIYFYYSSLKGEKIKQPELFSFSSDCRRRSQLLRSVDSKTTYHHLHHHLRCMLLWCVWINRPSLPPFEECRFQNHIITVQSLPSTNCRCTSPSGQGRELKLYLFWFVDHERVGCVRKTSLKEQEKSGSGQRGEANKRTEGRKKGRKERAVSSI